MLCKIGIYNGYSFFYLVFILRSPPVLLLYSWCFIPFPVLISLLLSIFSWIFLLLLGVHPPVSYLIAVPLMFYSVSCVNLFNFIHIFREFCKCLVVLFNKHIFTYGSVFFVTSAIRRSLSSCSIAHLSNTCSVVWLPFPHGQFGVSIILNRWR